MRRRADLGDGQQIEVSRIDKETFAVRLLDIDRRNGKTVYVTQPLPFTRENYWSLHESIVRVELDDHHRLLRIHDRLYIHDYDSQGEDYIWATMKAREFLDLFGFVHSTLDDIKD